MTLNGKYKKDTAKQYDSAWNVNDFCGHSICDLFVCKYYDSLKEEVVNSKYINIQEFNKNVIQKANKYINTEKCKKIKCIHSWPSDPLNYDIPYESPLIGQHLHSLILYCDFSDFCTDFSSTFRPIYNNEKLNKIKERNQKYHHIAKYLREIVQYYGINGWQESGPFYTGISFVMTIPSFSIRLNGPNSTSKYKEIAMRFATRDGIIIQLNNKSFTGKQEVFFDCSWLSAFPEEEERLLFGGRWKLEIETIIIMETKQNYQQFMHAFYAFDQMLSGECSDLEDKIKKSDIDIIGLSINNYLGLKQNSLDKYINDTFHLFTNNKSQIILNLDEMWRYVKDKKFISLIMHSVKEQGVDDIGDNNNNCFKSSLFNLFPNLKEIIIYTSSYHYYYPINILNLLSTICSSLLPKSFHRIIIKENEECKWIGKVFDISLCSKYIDSNLLIVFKSNEDRKGDELIQKFMNISFEFELFNDDNNSKY